MPQKPVNKRNPQKNEQKTSPGGTAPDKAHAARATMRDKRNTETEETFDSSPQNAESKQTRRLK